MRIRKFEDGKIVRCSEGIVIAIAIDKVKRAKNRHQYRDIIKQQENQTHTVRI